MRKVQVIVTHADNNALGFYEKLGFSEEEFVDNRLLGNRHFSESTIMQARIQNNVDYMTLRKSLKKQRDIILQKYLSEKKYNPIAT